MRFAAGSHVRKISLGPIGRANAMMILLRIEALIQVLSCARAVHHFWRRFSRLNQ
jgi:hypothetical protein